MVKIKAAPESASAQPVDVADDPAQVRPAAGLLARGLPVGHAELNAGELAGDRLAAFVEGLVLGCYRFTRATSPQPAVESIELCGATDTAAIERGLRTVAATVWARELANTRSGEK